METEKEEMVGLSDRIQTATRQLLRTARGGTADEDEVTSRRDTSGLAQSPATAFSLYTLPAKGLLGVSGEHHHAPALKAAVRAGTRHAPAAADAYARDIVERERAAVWIQVELLPEPTNRHDRNAIAVRSGLSLIGYVPRDAAGDYRETFDLLRDAGYDGAVVPAFVRKDEQQVVLCLSTGYHCYRSVRDDLITRRVWECLRAGEDAAEVAGRFGWSGTGPLRRTVRRWAGENQLPDPETEEAQTTPLLPTGDPQAPRRAGWFPDPYRRARLRYWDGVAWTANLADDDQTSSDPLPPPGP